MRLPERSRRSAHARRGSIRALEVRTARGNGNAKPCRQRVTPHVLRLYVATEPSKPAVHRRARLSLEIVEQDMITIGDLDQEVSLFAWLSRAVIGYRLSANAGCIGSDAERGIQGVLSHRGNYRLSQPIADGLLPARQGTAIDSDTVASAGVFDAE
jgi:hypothetical protein